MGWAFKCTCLLYHMLVHLWHMNTFAEGKACVSDATLCCICLNLQKMMSSWDTRKNDPPTFLLWCLSSPSPCLLRHLKVGISEVGPFFMSHIGFKSWRPKIGGSGSSVLHLQLVNLLTNDTQRWCWDFFSVPVLQMCWHHPYTVRLLSLWLSVWWQLWSRGCKTFQSGHCCASRSSEEWFNPHALIATTESISPPCIAENSILSQSVLLCI